MSLPAIERPNGKLYRPRKIAWEFLVDDDQIETAIIIWGTHDINRARRLSYQIADQIGLVAADYVQTWMHRSISYGNIRYCEDPELGRPCVYFRELVEIPSAPLFAVIGPMPATPQELQRMKWAAVVEVASGTGPSILPDLQLGRVV